MSSYIYGFHPVTALLATPEKIICIYLQEGRHDQRMDQLVSLAEKAGIVIKKTGIKELNQLTEFANHQGVVAEMTGEFIFTEADILTILQAQDQAPVILILDGIQDPHNLGACLRTANAAGVTMVIAPKDNAARITPVVRKVASGAAESTPFIQVTNLARTIRLLKAEGVWVYGTSADAKQSIFQAKLPSPIAWVLGAEGKGMRRLTEDLCDELVHIPMLGSVSSLNVSVATGVVLFETMRQSQGTVS